MSSFYFDSSFANQFRQKFTVQFSTEGISYQNLTFRTFGIAETEIPCLSEFLIPKFHDENIVHRLLVKATNKDMPDAEQLHRFAIECSNKLLTYSSAESYTSPHYSHIIEMLHSFLELVQEFETNGIQELCTKLTDYFTNEINQQPGNCEAGNLYRNMEDYMYRIGEYFQHFHLLMQNESESNENKSRVLVMSEVAYYLDKIFILTEKLISNTESTLDLLSEWEIALLLRDEQELYN